MIRNDDADPRTRILARLKAAPPGPPPTAGAAAAWIPPVYGPARLARFRAMLEASRAELHEVTAQDWPNRLKVLLAAKGVARMLYAPATEAGNRVALAWTGTEAPMLLGYDRPVEQLKPLLVGGVDAALTTARGGIAHTGTLVLWPSPDEPRLMSLLPPIHVVLIAEHTLADTLSETMSREGWAGSLPANALLISGPSKTADIEQTLAYGVHGPKDLIVLLIRDGESPSPLQPSKI